MLHREVQMKEDLICERERRELYTLTATPESRPTIYTSAQCQRELPDVGLRSVVQRYVIMVWVTIKNIRLECEKEK